MTKVSIVIVNYNVREFLIQCIESIYKSNFDLSNIEIIVVDNNSIDGSIEYISKKFPSIICISNKINAGFSKANNQGIQIASGEYILILNPDTLLQEDTLITCIEYMQKNIKCGVIGVKMIDGKGKYLPESKRGEPTLWRSFTKFSGLSLLFPESKFFSGYYLGHLNKDEIQSVEVLCGAFMFFRKEVLKRCNGFDEDYFMYGEDIDLSMKVHKLDYEVIYLPTTKIIHFKGESTKKTSFNYVKNFYNAMKIYVSKNYHGWYGTLLKLMLNAIIFIAAFTALLKNILIDNIRLIIDAAFIFFGTQILKQWWGNYHFQDAEYFNNAASYYNNLGITFIYTFSLWFFGQYDNNWRIKRLLFAVIIAFLLSMSIYALLPLELRSSRIIILISGILGFVIPYLTKYIFYKIVKAIKYSQDGSNYLIVAHKGNADMIKELIKTYDRDANLLGTINPIKNDSQDNYYLNNITNLTKVAKTINANKIVLCTEDLDNHTILDVMVLPDNEVNYIITSVNKKSLLESNDKNKSGLIYLNHSAYNLSQKLYMRLKRAFDLTFTICSILLLPFFIFIPPFREKIYPHIFSILIGNKTLVGYNITSKIDLIENNLPIIKMSIFDNSCLMDNIKYFPVMKTQKEANTYYAKHYTPIMDMEIITKNIFS